MTGQIARMPAMLFFVFPTPVVVMLIASSGTSVLVSATSVERMDKGKDEEKVLWQCLADQTFEFSVSMSHRQ